MANSLFSTAVARFDGTETSICCSLLSTKTSDAQSVSTEGATCTLFLVVVTAAAFLSAIPVVVNKPRESTVDDGMNPSSKRN